jgi:hypothetical protein
MTREGLRFSLARLLFWLGGLALLGGVASLAAGIRILPPELLIGAALTAFGLNTLLAGELLAGPEPRYFTVRGQVVRGEAIVRAGLADLTVGRCGIDRVANMKHGPLGKPKFSVIDGVANLRMANGLVPNIAQWEANLATNVLWDLDVRSSLGGMMLDLSALRMERVVARSGLGRMEIRCPERGFAQLFLRTGIGEIEVTLPEETGARIFVEEGGLGTLRVENERITALDDRRYITPDFETASAQVEIKIEGGSGDVVIR